MAIVNAGFLTLDVTSGGSGTLMRGSARLAARVAARRAVAKTACEPAVIGATTRFVAGAEVKIGGQTLKGTVDLGPTLERIESGGTFPHRNDGSIFMNREELLPAQPDGYYREFVHPTPGVSGPGPQRIIQGQAGDLYYTPNHYETFVPLN